MITGAELAAASEALPPRPRPERAIGTMPTIHSITPAGMVLRRLYSASASASANKNTARTGPDRTIAVLKGAPRLRGEGEPDVDARHRGDERGEHEARAVGSAPGKENKRAERDDPQRHQSNALPPTGIRQGVTDEKEPEEAAEQDRQREADASQEAGKPLVPMVPNKHDEPHQRDDDDERAQDQIHGELPQNLLAP